MRNVSRTQTRDNRIRCLAALVAFCISVCAIAVTSVAQTAQTIAFTNGSWFNGESFEQKTGYSIGGVLSFRPPSSVDRTIDLKGGFVIPPFAEAHNHNVESLNNIDNLIATYLRHGIFYVKNPNNLTRDRQALAPKLNRPDSIDVVFSNAGLTGSGGHPTEIPERVIARGLWTEKDREGGFYYTLDNEADLETKWPSLLATKPDFIKTYLLYSGEYEKRQNDPHFYAWKGLNPVLLKLVVKKAHAAGLRVSTHIEDAVDFHNALVAQVDEINHMPGFRIGSDPELHPFSEFQISDADAARATKQGTYVVTTLAGGGTQSDLVGRRIQNALNIRNLQLLLKYKVKIALGSDSYQSDTVPEALYLASLHVISNLQLLNMWCTTTAETIFPGRRIGHLSEGYEASFVVLGGDPSKDFSAVQEIKFCVKQGHVNQSIK